MLKLVAGTALSFLLLASPVIAATRATPESQHAAALRVVLATQATRIYALDPDASWDDLKEHSWSVRRPVHSGVLDMTHTFAVSYSIDGAVVATWTVDTRAGTAVEIP